MVQCVTGEVPSTELGRVLMHEHVFTRSPGVTENYPETFPRTEVVAKCVAALGEVREKHGVRTLVDHTTIELGRDIGLLAEISIQAEVQIVACAGLWWDPPEYFSHRSAEHAAGLFIRDILEGMQGTSIRAGFVKCGIDAPGLTSGVRVGIRAAAIAHRATGVPLLAHTWVGNRSGETLIGVLTAEGVDLRRVVVGHSGDTEDLGYLRNLLESGAWLGMDRFGIEDRLPDDRRVQVVARLCAEGYSDRLLLSQDASIWSGRLTPEFKARTRPNWGLTRIFDYVVPSLMRAGVDMDDIDRMLVDNPRRLFSDLHSY